MASRRGVAGAIRSLVNAKGLQLQCTRALHVPLFVNVLMYGSEAIIWKEKESSRVRSLQIDNLRGLLGIGRMDKVRLHG